ncbi:hypothetical protein B9T23_07040 [Acinetobacter terrae]|uniref:hypothetical protein n=1 Tax=Acinetobacter terrae TaxID=2731247 RepID=UPI000A34FA4F|nr:hypothetical protein [Acinetobacter terrae]OTG76746.1 hypothetical protein B9T23_07040 [Acinetobacter terrae]
MVKLIKTTILINIIMLATGCSSMMQNSISFAIKGQNKSYIYKNTWPECANFKINSSLKYNDLSDSCKISPEGYVPEQIIIEYAPWLTYEDRVKAGLGNVRSFFHLDELPRDKWPSDEVLHAHADNIERKIMTTIDNLPPTAWKQIVLTPPKEVEKYKYQLPEGKGNSRRGKNIHYIISLNPDGSYDIETKLYWVQKYQERWN